MTKQNVFVGKSHNQNEGNVQLYQALKENIQSAEGIDIIVSFLMDSGLNLLLKELKKAADKGIHIRILTSTYLNITRPSALYILKKELGDKLELRFYQSKDAHFHPKAYIFHFKEQDEIILGSSNLSFSALTQGIEWNYRFNSKEHPEDYQRFYSTFLDLFENHSINVDDENLMAYAKAWKKPKVEKEIPSPETAHETEEKSDEKQSIIEPTDIQTEALFALDKARKEGIDRGLVQAATGIGKTYLSALDVLSGPFNRVLFLAHREEILKQAKKSFEKVHLTKDTGLFLAGQKEADKRFLFASVFTLAKDEYLNPKWFSPDDFDYIIVDESHHAAAQTYQKILSYFHPKFLLGLTATPDRLDGKDIFQLCDYNLVHEVSIKEAINKGALVPFHYYGIYDEMDYSGVEIVNGKYNVRQLTELYKAGRFSQKRVELIYKNYLKYRGEKAIGFCCSIEHAEFMADQFNKLGIASIAVHSQSGNREEAIQQLENGEIEVIFTVDLFNEGVDIPVLDTVLFLRPTESSTIFLQQLGRGLRLYPGKEYLTALDFIGNYQSAFLKPAFLSGSDPDQISLASMRQMSQTMDLAEDCLVDFDFRLIDVFKEMEKAARQREENSISIKDRFLSIFWDLKNRLGRIPSRLELFNELDYSLYKKVQSSRISPFKNYVLFLDGLDLLSDEERELFNGPAGDFLNMIETTSMTKSYKMPILLAFYNGGLFRKYLTDEEIIENWKTFFDHNYNWRDLGVSSYKDYQKITDKKHLANAVKNPIHFLSKSGKGYLRKGKEYRIEIDERLYPYLENPEFLRHFKDIVDFRTGQYYRSRFNREKETKRS